MPFDFSTVKEILNTDLEHKELFKTAFTHRSYLNEHSSYQNPSNERLEFLGDAVLQLLSSEFLYQKYSNAPEGVLTNYRSSIVCTKSLAQEAMRLGFGEMLLLSKGEEATGGRDREYILANTFESVLGALYKEKGIEFCREFVERELFHKIDTIVKNESYLDSKSKFQELSQDQLGITPEYKVLDTWGPDHERMFKVGVYLADEMWGQGEGKSKQKAEQKAANAAFDKLSERGSK